MVRLREDVNASDLTVVGASARAAAASVRRAGWRACGTDLFGDVDLRAIAAFEPLGGAYPKALVQFLGTAPSVPWIYTGALENHPGLVEELARIRPLWGNDAPVLRRVRDPFVLGKHLREGDFRFPASRPADSVRLPTGWLAKPYQSAGGHGIESIAQNGGTVYHQERIAGEPYSAVYVASGTRCELFGVSRQLVGLSWLHAAPFAWCGNIGPAVVRQEIEDELAAIGRFLTERFGLRGLFGVDCIIESPPLDRLWTLEVNPRYPASVEVLELALGRSALALHAQAFGGKQQKPDVRNAAKKNSGEEKTGVVGKAVLYAPWDLRVPDDFGAPRTPEPYEVPDIADIPAARHEIKAGAPVLTVFTTAKTDADCVAKLAEKASALLQPPGRQASAWIS